MSHLVSKRVKLRFSPRITFKMDNSFEVANNIENIIDSVKETELSEADV